MAKQSYSNRPSPDARSGPSRAHRGSSSGPFSGAGEGAPALSMLRNHYPLLWQNPGLQRLPVNETGKRKTSRAFDLADLLDARRQLDGTASLLNGVFPQTRPNSGLLRSRLVESQALTDRLRSGGATLRDPLLVKCDCELPLSGSTDVRAALFHLVELLEGPALATAPSLAVDPQSKASYEGTPTIWRQSLAGRKLTLDGSSNHWLALTLLACPLGCEVEILLTPNQLVPDWKVERARLAGARILPTDPEQLEYMGSRSSHFVAERSKMLGYGVAAVELAEQFEQAGLKVGAQQPLFVYLPGCDGLLAGALATSLRLALGEHVYCFAGDTTNFPAFSLDFISGRRCAPSSIGIKRRTRIEGFEHGCRSNLALAHLRRDSAGCFTSIEQWVFAWLFEAHRLEGLRLEPAAAVGFAGVERVLGVEGRRTLQGLNLATPPQEARHLVWATSGGLLPPSEFAQFRAAGRSLAETARGPDV